MGQSVQPEAGRDPAGAGGIARMTSADAKDAIEQLTASPLTAAGKVCLVGFDAIRARMGERWSIRREMVYEHFERTVQKRLGAHGYSVRVSETDYLIAQPDVSRLAGQAYCLNCLREVLHYFLGEARVSDILVHEIIAIEESRITATKLDVLAVEAAEVRERPTAAPQADPAAAATLRRMTSQDRWTPFVANDGRKLRASSSLEPVFHLKTQKRIGYRMARRVLALPAETQLSSAEVRRLPSTDIEKIDFATLARGLDRLGQDTDSARQPSLILPVSFTTLSSQRGRAVLADFFRAAQASVQKGLICEVCDIEGVPPSALLAATSLIRPFCLFVVGRLRETPTAPLKALQDAGLQGLSIELPSGLEADADFVPYVRGVLAAARPVTKTVLFFRLAGPRQAAMAGILGATHGSFTPATAEPIYVDQEPAAAPTAAA
jgi:hypothetical protein